MAFLRRQAFKNVIYLDDFCQANQDKLSRQRTLATAWLLVKLGFTINWRKSSPYLSQRENFFRFVVDTMSLLVLRRRFAEFLSYVKSCWIRGCVH